MKCKMCGSNYPTEELKCPYCGTPNEVGIKWKNRENEIKNDINEEKEKSVKKTPIYVINKVLNVIIIIMIICIIGFFVASYAASLIDEARTERLIKSASADECEELMKSGDYAGLYTYLNKYEVYGESGFEKYTECVRLYDQYEILLENAFRICQKNDWPTEGITVRKYQVENEIEKIKNILSGDSYRYTEIMYDENKEYYEKIKQDARAIAIGTFDMTEEEMDELMDIRVYSDEYDAFVKKICERKGWDYED